MMIKVIIIITIVIKMIIIIIIMIRNNKKKFIRLHKEAYMFTLSELNDPTRGACKNKEINLHIVEEA